uniref:Uncharacterized protein n=1 Tax=Hucho hucho TaxID=62062 RepID=A0A4W5KXM8_9TELE
MCLLFSKLCTVLLQAALPRNKGRDQSKRTIVYIKDPATEALSDSLEFRVSDPLGNTGPSHILELKWSHVELAVSEYQAYENQGAVSLNILRKGNVAESSYITIKVSDLSLLKQSIMSKMSWQMEIAQDQLEEA